MKIDIQAIHFSADKKLITFIEKKLDKLQVIYDKIISVNVILKLENTGQVKDKIVEMKLNIPGSSIFVKESNKVFEESTDQAINSLKKQLVKYKSRKKQKDTLT